jgi:hypothetical protein
MKPERFVSALYFDGENPAHIIDERYAKQIEPPKADTSNPEVRETLRLRRQNFKLISLRQQLVDLHVDSDRSLAIIESTLGRLQESCLAYPLGLLVFDSLSCFHVKNENSNAEMRGVIQRFARLADKYGVAVILIHHEGKPGERGERPAEHAPRGASSIRDCVDTSFQLKYSRATERRDLLLSKWRGSPPRPEDMEIKFRPEADGGLSVVLVGPSDARLTEGEKEPLIETEITEALKTHPNGLLARQLREKCLGRKGTTVDRIRKRLVEEGIVRAEKKLGTTGLLHFLV